MDGQNDKTVLVKTSVAFVTGLIVGAVTTYFAVRKKERDRADAEIEDVVNRFKPKVVTKEEYKEVLEKAKEEILEKGPQDDPSPDDKPYILSLDEYTDDMDYDKETLIYYEGDDVLTDQFDHVIEIEDVIGREPLNHFGEEEEDIVYVRNHKLMTDYEVVLERKSSPPTALAEGDEDDG